MNKMINDMAMGMMKNPNQPKPNQPSTKPAPYSRTTQQQPNVQQITPKKQEQVKSNEKIQPVGKIARHGNRHQLIQKSPVRSKEEIQEVQQQQPVKANQPFQRTSYNRNPQPQTKIQEKPVQIKANIYGRPSRQAQVKPANQTSQIKVQSPKQSQITIPASILYPKRGGQYKIKSNQKIDSEKKTPTNKSPQVKVQENTNYQQQNRYSYGANNKGPQYIRATQNQTTKIQETQTKVENVSSIQRPIYPSRSNQYSKNPANIQKKQQVKVTESTSITINQKVTTTQKSSYGSRPYGAYGKNVPQISKLQQNNQPAESIQPSQKVSYSNRSNIKTQQITVNATQVNNQSKIPTSINTGIANKNLASKNNVVQQKIVEQSIQPKNEQKKQKPRSNMIIYALSRLQNTLKSQSWGMIKQYASNRSKKLQTLGKMLTERANSTSLQYLDGLKKHFFKQVKNLTLKQFKANQKTTEQSLQRNSTKQKSLICWLIEALFKQKIRSAYKKLNNNRNKLDLVSRGVVCLGVISKKKQAAYKKQFMDNLKNKANDKMQKLSMMMLCLKNYYDQRKKTAFSKLIKHNLPKPVKKTALKKLPSIQKPLQPISTPPSNVFIPSKQSIENIKLTIGEKKDSFLTQKRYYQDAISEFKAIVKKNQSQVSQMSSRNEELKNKLQIVRGNEQQVSSSKQQIDPEEIQILNKLTQIYIEIFKLPDDSQYLAKDLIQEHKLPTAKIASDPSIQNWQLMLQHTNLKNLIQSIEGIRPKQRKAVIVMQEQQKVIKNLIRSYVKERYLWQWVRASIHV